MTPHAHDTRTSATLLGRLRAWPTDQAAWGQFVKRYCPRIFGWCRRWGLHDHDAEDVTQDVLLKLGRRLATFSYDPSRRFRDWLQTVAQHAYYDFLNDRRKNPAFAGGGELLDGVAARADLLSRLREEFDLELLEEARARARLRVRETTWEAFRLKVMERLPSPEVARRLGLTVAQVYVYSRRVVRRIKAELRRLEGAAGRHGDPSDERPPVPPAAEALPCPAAE
jgi:RNA polymerase sigma-70 factor (ECF subfamily)